MAYYEEAIAILEDSGDKDKVAYTLNNIGKVHEARGDLTKAMEHYQKARKTAEAISANLELTQTLLHIGKIQIKQN